MINRRTTKRAALAALKSFLESMKADKLSEDSTFLTATYHDTDGFIIKIERRVDCTTYKDYDFFDDHLPF